MAYGKIPWVSDNDLMYRAVADQTNIGDVYRETMLGPNLSKQPDQEMKFEYPIPRLKGGYLKRKASQWFIHPARVIQGETFVHVKYEDVEPIIGDRGRQYVHDIHVLPAQRRWSDRGTRGNKTLFLNLAVAQGVSSDPKEGYVHAKLVESGHMGKKMGEPPVPHQKHMHCAIYDPDPDAGPIQIPFDKWVRYQDDIKSISRGEKTDTRRLSERDPLFYLLDNDGNLVFFGPTMLFRLPYDHNAASYVPDCLKRTEDVDLAEAIFGTVREGSDTSGAGSFAIKGRVFFEDAIWDGQGNNPFLSGNDEFKSPKILSSPKPTAFQHYLVQPDPENKSKLRHYDSGPETTEIRGHKLYWHKKDVPEADMFEPNIMMDKQHTIVRPVKPGTCFKTRIRFENLSDIKLGALLSALNLPLSMRHKIGMGKPYGMGSVKIETTLRLTDPKSRYERVCTEDGGLELGLKSDTETVRIKEAFVKEFNDLIRAHDKERLSCDDGTIWSIPRIAQLGRMLEWNGAPPRTETDYVGLDNDGAKWWRQRRVLPTPEGVVNASGTSVANRPGPSAPHVTTPHPAIKSGTRVHCLLLEEKTKKGGWKAKTIEGGLKGHILPDNEPQGIKPDEQVELVIHGTDPKNLSFRWPGQ
jgi:CRISPR-associated protein (TIGR03986 family)